MWQLVNGRPHWLHNGCFLFNIMKQQRESVIEMYRAVLMLGIVMCHTVGLMWGGRVANLCGSAVIGFVFISGWFGIKFKWSKVLQLILIAAYSMLVSMLVAHFLLGIDYSIWSYLRVFKRIRIYWFLWAYIALMLVSPSIEFVFRYAHEHDASPFKIFLPFLIMVYGWSYLQYVPQFREIMPCIAGFDSLSVFSLTAAYLTARLCRYYDLRSKVWSVRYNVLWLILVGGLCMALVLAGFYHHHSIASIILTVVNFFLITKLRIPEKMGVFFVFIAPSLFSVYLMHCRGDGETILRNTVSSLDALFATPHILSCLIAAIIVMLVCIALDMPRRYVAHLIGKLKHRPI